MKYTNPLYQIVFMDSCALDPKFEPETSAAKELFEYYDEGKIHMTLAGSVYEEAQHKNTPINTKVEADYMVVSPSLDELSDSDIAVKKEIWSILTGNGKPEKMERDALHVFEAHRYKSYFITVDARINKLKDQIHKACNARIIKPSELLVLIHDFENS